MCSIDSSNDWNKPKTSFFSTRNVFILSCGSGDRALQECNPSAGPSVDCSDCIPPGSGKLLGPGCLHSGMSSAATAKRKLIVPSAVRPPFFDGLPTNSATDPTFKVVQINVLSARDSDRSSDQDRPCWRCSFVPFLGVRLSVARALPAYPDLTSRRAVHANPAGVLSMVLTVFPPCSDGLHTMLRGSAWLRGLPFRAHQTRLLQSGRCLVIDSAIMLVFSCTGVVRSQNVVPNSDGVL